MARDFQIYGEAMVAIRLPEHVAVLESVPSTGPERLSGLRPVQQGGGSSQGVNGQGQNIHPNPSSFSKAGATPGTFSVKGAVRAAFLGMTEGPITVSPRAYYAPVRVDDAGPNMQADVLFAGVEVDIDMDLIHFDRRVLDICVEQSLGAGVPVGGHPNYIPNVHKPLGGGNVLYASGNCLLGVNIVVQSGATYLNPTATPISDPPWNFPAAYLNEQPFTAPIGTNASVLSLHWRAVLYLPTRRKGYPHEPLSGGPINFVEPIVGAPGAGPSTRQTVWSRVLDPEVRAILTAASFI